MKSNLLRRTLALTVAAAMTISSVPANLVFAEEEPVIMEDEAAIVADEPEAAEEAAAGAGTELSIESAATDFTDDPAETEFSDDPVVADEDQPIVEDDFVADIAEVVSEDVPEGLADPAESIALEDQIATISAEAPKYKVSELCVDGDTLSWHMDEQCKTYEFDITDGQYTYFRSVDEETNTPSCPTQTGSDAYSSVDIEDLFDYVHAYTQVGGVWTEAENVAPLRNGVKYQISVRAVGTDGVTKSPTAGPVEYTYTGEDAPKAPTANTTPGTPVNLRQEGNQIVWDAPDTGAEEYRLVITDEAGNYYYSYENYTSYIDGYYDADTGEWIPGESVEKYKLSNARNSDGKYYFSSYSALYAYKQTAEDADYVTTEPVRVTDGNGNALKAFAPGKIYFVQVYAVNSGEDADGNRIELKSTPTAAVAVQNGLVGKTDGLMIKNDQLSWLKLDEYTSYSGSYDDIYYGYEIVAKDAAGNIQTETLNQSDYYYDITSFDVNALSLAPGTYTLTVRAYMRVELRDDNGAVRSETIYGEASNAVSYTIADVREGGKATPGAVTGLAIKKDNEEYLEGYILYNPSIEWNQVYSDFDHYEIELTDADGYAYYDDYTVEVAADNSRVEKPVYFDPGKNTSVEVSEFVNCNTYMLPADASLTRRTNAEGRYLTAYDAGRTYKVRVRAVDEYERYDATTKTWKEQVLAGPWSGYISYQVGAISPITNLKLLPNTDESKDSCYYFGFTAPKGTVYYQCSTDPTFADKSDFAKDEDNDYKLRIAKDNLLPNTTYYLRAVNTWNAEPTNEEADALMATNKGMVISFTTEAVKTITGLKVKEETSDGYELIFNAGLKRGDKYDVQYSTNGTDWRTLKENQTSGTIMVFTSELQEGINHVRAVAYIEVYNEEEGEEEKVYGTPSNEVTLTVNTAPAALSGFALKTTQDGYEFTYTNVFHHGESVKLQVADSKSFVETDSKSMIYNDDFEGGYLLNFSLFTPGKKYYARACVYSPNAKEGKFGPWSKVITITPKVAKIRVSMKDVGSTTLCLSMSGAQYNEDYLSGYQIQRKDGKKWVTLANTTDTEYKDSGLQAQTKYQYRVRPYYYIAKTKKYVYGSFVNCEAMTWGGALNLIVKATSKTSAKLSWDTVSGAEGYEIYRSVMTSSSSQKAGYYYDSYSDMKLVKTITKATVKSYTDKTLTSGLSYNYTVRAYKTIDKEKFYVSAVGNVDLSMRNFRITDRQDLTSGKVKITWTPIYTAQGYLIEKLDNATGKWSTQKDITKAKTSTYTLPATKDSRGVQYRIRAYTKGKKEYSNTADIITVSPYLQAPTNVKAVAQKDGSIKISWKKVSGADYYTVHRTTSSAYTYDKVQKIYSYSSGIQLTNYVKDEAMVSGYRVANDELTGNVFYDSAITYTTVTGVKNTLREGPQKGVQYYYYVVAHRKGTEYSYDYEDSIGQAYSADSEAAAVIVSKTTVAKPSKVKAVASKSKIKVSWKKVKNAKGYVVYRSLKKKSGYVPVGYLSSGKKNTVTYTDLTVKKGKVYYYKVRAFKANEVGANVYSKDSKVGKAKAK